MIDADVCRDKLSDMFIKNCWYVAAYVRELEDGGRWGAPC